MKTITRSIIDNAEAIAKTFRAICIVGPRQSGKTTLSRLVFKTKAYVNFEDPATETEASLNLKAFVSQYKAGAIFDEVQRLPDIFRYLQGILDADQRRGKFILTGSANFLLQEQISQSLAGRVGYLELLPLSFAELQQAGLAYKDINDHILKGGYPEIWQHNLNSNKWMASYVQTYVQRDVRLIKNILNLGAFTRFLNLCANYAGQIINKDALAANTGVDSKTIQSWLAVLESSYIIYLLQPYHSNLNKRVIKSPKLYFYDTGLLCYLLGISTKQNLIKYKMYGAIFENWIMTEIRKNRYNSGLSGGMYFFRDSAGNEVDCILEKDGEAIAIEIKSAKNYNTNLLGSINYWRKYNAGAKGILIYGGSEGELINDEVSLLSWQEIGGV